MGRRRYPGPLAFLPDDVNITDALGDGRPSSAEGESQWSQRRQGSAEAALAARPPAPDHYTLFHKGAWVTVCEFLDIQRNSDGTLLDSLRDKIGFTLSDVLEGKADHELRVPKLVVTVLSVSQAPDGSVTLTLLDPTGRIHAYAHADLVEEYGPDLAAGCVLVLHKVAIFISGPGIQRWLNLTPNNVISFCGRSVETLADDTYQDSEGCAAGVNHQRVPGWASSQQDTKDGIEPAQEPEGALPLLDEGIDGVDGAGSTWVGARGHEDDDTRFAACVRRYDEHQQQQLRPPSATPQLTSAVPRFGWDSQASRQEAIAILSCSIRGSSSGVRLVDEEQGLRIDDGLDMALPQSSANDGMDIEQEAIGWGPQDMYDNGMPDAPPTASLAFDYDGEEDVEYATYTDERPHYPIGTAVRPEPEVAEDMGHGDDAFVVGSKPEIPSLWDNGDGITEVGYGGGEDEEGYYAQEQEDVYATNDGDFHAPVGRGGMDGMMDAPSGSLNIRGLFDTLPDAAGGGQPEPASGLFEDDESMWS